MQCFIFLYAHRFCDKKHNSSISQYEYLCSSYYCYSNVSSFTLGTTSKTARNNTYIEWKAKKVSFETDREDARIFPIAHWVTYAMLFHVMRCVCISSELCRSIACSMFRFWMILSWRIQNTTQTRIGIYDACRSRSMVNGRCRLISFWFAFEWERSHWINNSMMQNVVCIILPVECRWCFSSTYCTQ